MQRLVDILARWFCTCGARPQQPSLPPISQPPLPPIEHNSPSASECSSPPSPSSSVVRAVLAHIPSHASPRSASPSTSSLLTQIPNDEHPPQQTTLADPPATNQAVPMKAPPPRPPPSISPNAYQARSSASSSQHALPSPCLCPTHAKAPPPYAYQIHASQIERRLGLHWASYAFLTFSQYSEGWQTWYTDDYSMVFFYNRATGTSRWSPLPLPEDTDADGSTGGT